MAEHFTASDVDREAKMLKRDLEGWREVLLPLNSIMMWDKTTHPGLIFAFVTSLFLLVWKSDPSILTALSFFGIIAALVDYLVPTIAQHFCHSENWTAAKERKLEAICHMLAANKIGLVNFVKSFYQMRKDRPKLYYTLIISTLLILSWIGNVTNNLFLTYMFVLFLLLLPGLVHHGYLDQVLNVVAPLINKIQGTVIPMKKLD